MDLTKYKYPEPSLSMPTDKKLLAEAKARGFYNKSTPYNELFSSLFFTGGTLNFKKDLDSAFKDKAVPFLKGTMQSWDSQHEDKEAVCAMLLSELVTI
jgi:hypothetical protein